MLKKEAKEKYSLLLLLLYAILKAAHTMLVMYIKYKNLFS